MRRLAVLLTLVAGCGFKAPGSEPNQATDAPPGSVDAPPGVGSDAPMPDAMIDAPSGPQCSAGYAPIAGLSTASPSKYRFVSGATTWIAAEMDCEDDGQPPSLASHLVVLDSVAERTAMIAGPLGSANLPNQSIGLTDLEDEDEDPRYVTNQQNTLSLSPTMDADNKDCIRVKNATTDEYRDCNEMNAYVCECDASAASSSRYPNAPDGNGNGGGGGGGP